MASSASTWRSVAIPILPLLLSGCVLAPPGTVEERERISEAGKPYEPPVERRSLPELDAQPTWRDVLHRAFLANGDLEAAYFEWKAASARIDMAAAYPNTNLSLGFEYMFSGEKMKSWDRTTISAAPDAMANLSFPTKVIQSGKVALDNARAAGNRFETAKFDLQRKVLTAYLDYALMAEKLRIQRDNLSLLKLLADIAEARNRAGGPQQDLLKAQTQYRLAENELATMESDLSSMRAMLNGMLARAAGAPLQPPRELPEPRKLLADDAGLIAVAIDRNPELAGLARQVEGRQDALTLARMQYIPDINPTAGLTGSISQFAGLMITLPTTIPMIRAGIEEARAMLRAQEAMTRQTRFDRAANFVASLYAMRNAERQSEVFEVTILPKAEQALLSSRQAYTAGAIGFIELIDSQRTVLEIRLLAAESRIAREKRLAELEALAGVDIETLGRPSQASTTAPSTQPTTRGARP